MGISSNNLPCCWDAGNFAEAFLRNRCGWIPTPGSRIPWAPARSVELREIAKLAPLAILSTELGHGETRREALASASLGAAKDYVTLAASKVMAIAKRSHAAAFGTDWDRLQRQRLRKDGCKRTSRAAAMRRLLKKRRSPRQGRCAQNGWNLHRKDVFRARRNALLRVAGLQDPDLEAEGSTRWRQLPAETKAYYSIQAKHMNMNENRRPGAAAPPPPDPAARCPRPSNWGMGNESMFTTNHCSTRQSSCWGSKSVPWRTRFCVV